MLMRWSEDAYMNWAHVHLVINHLPVILAPVAAVVLGAGLVRKSGDLIRAGLVIMTFAAVTGGGAYFTGEPAEDVVEHLPAVSDSMIDEHEDAALFGVVFTAVGGLLAVAALASKRAPAWLVPATLAVAVLATVILARTAYLGGQISHPEIRGATPGAGRTTA
jgi:uncharacterized membrane protein